MSEAEFRRGDVVVCVLAREDGKPRPAVVMQSDLFNETHASVVLCPVSSELTGLSLFRVALAASDASGLRKESEVMVDNISAVKRERVTRRIGRLLEGEMGRVDQALRLWLDLGG